MEERHRAGPAGAQHLHEGRRREDRHASTRPRDALGVAARGPPEQLGLEHEPRFAVVQDERAVREPVERTLAPRAEPLFVEPRVDRVGPRADDRDEAHVVRAAALGAGPVPGGECGRLVEEEEPGVPAGRHRAVVPTTELEATRDPALADEAAADPPLVVVESPAVAEDEAALGRRDQLSARCDPVPERHETVSMPRTGGPAHLRCEGPHRASVQPMLTFVRSVSYIGLMFQPCTFCLTSNTEVYQ